MTSSRVDDSPATEAELPPRSLIPVIDFSPFLYGSAAEKQATASAILKAFQTSGFIYLAKHGIAPATVEDVFATSAKFFTRPQEQKDGLQWTTPESNRGYVAHGREKVSQLADRDQVEALRSQNPDLKESMEIGKDGVPGRPNRWPDELDDEGKHFKTVMQQFFRTCKDLNIQIMRALALGMGLGESYFDEYTDGGDNNLRLLHYPATPKEVFAKNKGQVRAGEHSDYGSITLLFQDARGGLQVCGPNGTFLDATPIPGTIVINAGDLLARWSNDTIKSTRHRVIEPPIPAGADGIYPPRYSVAYFCNPNFEKFIEVLPGTYDDHGVGVKGEKKYDGINSGQYLVQRLAATY
ncbi:MAG: hypothetical protein M1838_005452 [Thelocarpon superellum]|nr:MAG: hypothetical protein M1838_005452 [Thelocarpon superellum]